MSNKESPTFRNGDGDMVTARNILGRSREAFKKIDETKKEAEVKKEEVLSDIKTSKNVKELLYFGTLSKNVELAGFIFKIRTLTFKETQELAKILYNDEDRLVKQTVLNLAFSLETINGLSITEVYREMFGNSHPDANKVELALEILENLNLHLVGKLADEALKLSEESRKLLNLEQNETSPEHVKK